MSIAINEFVGWWGEGLAYFVPKRLKTSRRQQLPVYLLVRPSAGGFELEYVSRHVSSDSGSSRRLQITADSDRQSVRAWLADTLGSNIPTILRLPGDTVLSRRMSAPLVTSDKIRSMLEFEIDRQTPFSKEQVYFDFRLVGGGDSGKLDLELGVAPRAVVDGFVERLAGWDIHPQIIDTDDIRFDEDGFNLHEHDTAGGTNNKRRSIVVYAVLAAAAIGLLCFLPYYQSTTRISELESIEKQVRAQAADVAALKKTRDELDDQRRFIAELQSQGTDPLQIIGELTRLLPDDSWIIRFEMKNNSVTIQGESSSASSLIRLLQDSSLVDEPRFVSPITLNTASGKERFRISMSVVNGDPA